MQEFNGTVHGFGTRCLHGFLQERFDRSQLEKLDLQTDLLEPSAQNLLKQVILEFVEMEASKEVVTLARLNPEYTKAKD